MRVQHSMLPSSQRKAKPRRGVARNSNTVNKDEEEGADDTEMVTLSDYESMEKPTGATSTPRFTDEELGIVRGPYEDEEEEAEILSVRKTAAVLLKSDHGIGNGVLDEDEGSDADEDAFESALLAAAAAADGYDSPHARRASRRGKPDPFDLINNAVPGKSVSGSTPAELAKNPSLVFQKLYLIEKAKLKFLQAENAELRKEWEDLVEENARVSASKEEALERTLTLELG